MKKNLKLSLGKNLQLFAEGGEGGDSGETTTTFTQEEMSKIQAELDKQKKEKDKYAKELAELRKLQKDKLSEEEKKAQEQKEKDEEFVKMQKELLSIKISKEFMVAGFDENATKKIVETFTNGDSIEFAKEISNQIKLLIENVRKEEKTKFQQSSIIPPSGNMKENGLDPIVEKYINSRSFNNTNKARDMILGKK